MEDPPPLRDPSYASWSQSNSAIITWMLHSIKQNIAESLTHIKPARSLWQTLETMYANQTNIGRVVEIFESLLTLKQGNLSLQAHFGRMQALIQEVDLYQPPTTDLVTLKRYRPELYASIYLSGLRPSIVSRLRGSLLSGDHVPSITTIFSAALRVTTGMPSLPLSSAPGDTPPPLAMVVSTPRAHDDGGLPLRFDGNRPPRERGRNLFPPCPHYGKQNHPANKCWKQFGKHPTAQAVMTPPAPPNISAPPNIPTPQYHVTLTPAEYDALRCFASTDASSSASLASLPAPTTLGTSALLASSSPSWIIDSIASSLLSSYHLTPSHPPVTIADDLDLVQGRGTTRVTPSLSLHQILYVPDFPVNLLSISAITRALPCTITFFPFHCIFQDLYTGRRIGLGCENGRGIYELIVDEPSSGLQALFVTSTATSSLLWHRRLGHPCFEKIKKTLPWFSLTQFVCESCQLGKHHRSSYSSCDDIPSFAPFDLLHCVVWGPSRTPSVSGHRYYIVFVDDYTRVSWVYLLCDRSEVVTTVTHFITEVVTQYSTTPKILCTDNALEFFQTSLRTFCADRGIIHQTTCPHTSQQNGIAEQKHRQLLDITRTLLIEMHVLSYLWSDALMNVTSLQNRLPSAPLGGTIPLHRLQPTSSLFSLPPRVFGCIAFVQDHSPSLSKLAPHALKGVFVGYSRTQKGYRVYFLDTRRYMTSADVTFHEDSPFFSPPSPSPTLTAASPLPGFPPLVVIVDPCPSVPPPPLFLSSPSPPISSVQPISSAPDTDPLSPNSTATSPSPVVVPQAPPNDLHLPITLRQGTRACTQHPISHFVSYDRLSPSFHAFALLVASESIRQSHVEAAQVREWKAAMDHEVEALVS